MGVGRRNGDLQHPEFLSALASAPPVAECAWMRVDVDGERGPLVFALAVHAGWVVSAPRIARRLVGQRAKDVWRYWRGRGARLGRIG